MLNLHEKIPQKNHKPIAQTAKNKKLWTHLSVESTLIQAVKDGEDQIIELFHDPATNCKHMNELVKKLYELDQKKQAFIRKLRIRETQAEVLASSYHSYMNDTRHDKEITSHLETLKTKLSCNQFNLLITLREEHREMLALNTRIIIYDEKMKTHKWVKLNSALRIKLHRDFSRHLEEEFKTVADKYLSKYSFKTHSLKAELDKITTIQKGRIIYNDLVDEIQNLQSEINKYDRQIIDAIRESDAYAVTIRTESNPRKFQLIDAILPTIVFNIHEYPLGLTISTEDLNSVVVPETGDNLLHVALEAGRFETAILLINLGVNLKAINYQNVIAIDTHEEASSDTLIHFLARKQEFETICNLIMAGANPHLENKNSERLISIGNGAMITFLLEKLTHDNPAQKYLTCLFRLFSNKLLLKSLLLPNQTKQPAFGALSKIAKAGKNKDMVLKKIKEHVLQFTFYNKFQYKINALLWTHFFDLLSDPPMAVISLFSKNHLEKINSLIELQAILVKANETHSNEEIVSFLEKDESITRCSIYGSTYKDYLKLYKELINIQTRRKLTPDEQEFFSYSKFGANKNLFFNKNKPLTQRTSSKKDSDTSVKTSKTYDYFHWFDKSPKKEKEKGKTKLQSDHSKTYSSY